VDQDGRLFLRDLALILGLPALLTAGLVAWWQPWKYQVDSIIRYSHESREAQARAAGLHETTWRGLRVNVPDDYVILVQDSILEVLEWEPLDHGSGSWGSHLAFLPLTSEVEQRFKRQSENCTLAPGRCWEESAGTHALRCQQAAGMRVPELWWTPLTICEVDDLQLWIALNAPDAQRPHLWEIAHTVLRGGPAVAAPASRGP
jgi:hypothetical protein